MTRPLLVFMALAALVVAQLEEPQADGFTPISEQEDGRRLASDASAPRQRVTPSYGKHRRKRKSWLSAMGLGGTDKDGNAKSAKLPPLTLEEVLVGVFVIAIGGLMVSFSI